MADPHASLGLSLARTVAAPMDRVFEAWTEPALIRRWFAPPGMQVATVEVELAVGGKYRISIEEPGKQAVTVGGTYREIAPPQRLVFTWAWEGAEADETVVTVELTEADGQTNIALRHEMFANDEQRGKHQQGWTACLQQIEGLFARR